MKDFLVVEGIWQENCEIAHVILFGEYISDLI